jgi:hypothetical protein
MMATIAIGLAAVASVVSVATIAVAAPATPARTGLFATWRGAQAAAGFRLLRPTKTYGLVRASKIIVARCEISKEKARKRLVIGEYGLSPAANLTISQNNSNGQCTRTRKGKFLGRYHVDGVTAGLIGDCGMKGLPSCRSKSIFLFLTWRKAGVYYQASSYGKWRGVLVSFARGLVTVSR